MSDPTNGSGPVQGQPRSPRPRPDDQMPADRTPPPLPRLPPLPAIPVQNAQPQQPAQAWQPAIPRPPAPVRQVQAQPQQPAQAWQPAIPRPPAPVQQVQAQPQQPAQPQPPRPVQNPPPQLPPIPQPQPPVISATPVIAHGQDLPANREGTLSVDRIDTLPPDQRVWAENVLRALNLKSKGSQARVLAGAIAGVEQLRKDNSPDLAQATQLLATVTRAGDPPWKDTRKAMAANDAKMQIDLLTIPAASRRLEPLAGGGVNTTFTVDRIDADGKRRPAFLCKPATPDRAANVTHDKVLGIPDGGEVSREALAARAAQTFASQTGIDVRMPESHVVSLSSDMVPGGLPNGPPITASIQEFGAGTNQFKHLTDQQKAAIPPAQVAALAVYDLMTVNTDRHSGNIMCDAQGNMLPIDHGCSFAQGKDGRERIANTMGGPHNALLGLPAAFEPMPQDMVRKLKSMATADYGDSLRKDRDLIEAAHPGMAGKIDDDAIDTAQKAARFAKLAARNKPPLTPGSMHVAFAGHINELLDAHDFDAAAQTVIAEAVIHADTVKAVCLSDDAEYMNLARKVEELGWFVQPRGQPSASGSICDPVLMMSIIENRIKPGGQSKKPAAVALARSGTPTPATMKTRLLTLRLDLITDMIAAMPTADQPAQTAALNNLQGTEDQQMAASTPLLATVRDLAFNEQLAQFNLKLAGGSNAGGKGALEFVVAQELRDPVKMAAELITIN